jgi:hypothetical protein
MQPAMAAFFGIRDGLRDGRQRKAPYFRTIFTNPAERGPLIKSGLKSVAKILILAVLLDGIYQFIMLRWFYPGEAIIVAVLLAFVPYLFIRGPTDRICRRWLSRHSAEPAGYKSSKS